MLILKKPSPAIPTSFNTSQPKSSLLSRHTELEQKSFDHAVQERQKLKAAEYSAQDPVKSLMKQRGELLSRRIEQMQNKYGK